MKKIIKKTVISALVIFVVLIAGVYFYTHRPIHRIPSDEEDTNTVTFLALGDQGSGDVSQWEVAHAMEKWAEKTKDLDFVAFLGDNFYSKGITSVIDKKWLSRFEEVYQGAYLSSVPFYAVLGNHDHMGNPAAEIEYSEQHKGSNRWRMPNWYYSEDFGNAGGHPILRIVFIDTCLTKKELNQEAGYIKEQFSNTHVSPIWKVVIGHYPVRNYGKHGETPEVLSILLPALQESHVDLYLSGHDHDQQVIARNGEPLYFVSGGGGAELYTVKQGADDLLYSRSGHGFMAVRADKDALEIQHLDIDGTPEVQYSIDRKCSLSLRECLKQETEGKR